jgi:hypothetical protein
LWIQAREKEIKFPSARTSSDEKQLHILIPVNLKSYVTIILLNGWMPELHDGYSVDQCFATGVPPQG